MENLLVGGCDEGREKMGDAKGSEGPGRIFESFGIQISIVEIDAAESVHLRVKETGKEKVVRTSQINVQASLIGLRF
jgi:hypothetical protein